jgi:hypothetical protein
MRISTRCTPSSSEKRSERRAASPRTLPTLRQLHASRRGISDPAAGWRPAEDGHPCWKPNDPEGRGTYSGGEFQVESELGSRYNSTPWTCTLLVSRQSFHFRRSPLVRKIPTRGTRWQDHDKVAQRLLTSVRRGRWRKKRPAKKAPAQLSPAPHHQVLPHTGRLWHSTG